MARTHINLLLVAENPNEIGTKYFIGKWREHNLPQKKKKTKFCL